MGQASQVAISPSFSSAFIEVMLLVQLRNVQLKRQMMRPEAQRATV
jgi:hypothetical protein